jgi:hypothetical protein
VGNAREIDVEYLTAVATLYADDTTVPGSDTTTVSRVKAGGTWKFTISQYPHPQMRATAYTAWVAPNL